MRPQAPANLRAPTAEEQGPVIPEATRRPDEGQEPTRQVPTDVNSSLEPETLSAADACPVAPQAAARRSEQLEQVARQADRHTRRGFELASHRAYFAARAEFTAALRLIAQGLDTERQTAVHSPALTAGLTALKEAEDFLPESLSSEDASDVAQIIASHRTTVLKGSSEGLVPLTALKGYFSFAQEQLGMAAGREVCASMALYGLGKVHAAMATQKNLRVKALEPKAMAYYQAALLAFPHNHLAANDLGVLLARGGYYLEARKVLEHSLTFCSQSPAWHNLAAVYEKLGQSDLSRRAAAQASAARQAEAAARRARRDSSDQMVQWVGPNAFAETYARQPAWESTPVRSASPPPAAAPGPARPADKPVTGWRFPWTN